MRQKGWKIGLAIAGVVLGGSAGAEESPAALPDAIPLAVAVESLMPEKSCWRARLSESLRTAKVQMPTAAEDWELTLLRMAQRNGFQVVADRKACILTLTESMTARGLPPEVREAMLGSGGDAWVERSPLGVVLKRLLPPSWQLAYRDGLNGALPVNAELSLTINSLDAQIRDRYGAEIVLDSAEKTGIVRRYTGGGGSPERVARTPLKPELARGELSAGGQLIEAGGETAIVDRAGVGEVEGLEIAQQPEAVGTPGDTDRTTAEVVENTEEEVAAGEPDTQKSPVQPPVVTYKTLDEFLRDRVVADVRDASIEDVVRALVPRGWTIELRGLTKETTGKRLDLTTNEARGRVMSGLMKEMGLVYYPFVELQKIIITN